MSRTRSDQRCSRVSNQTWRLGRRIYWYTVRCYVLKTCTDHQSWQTLDINTALVFDLDLLSTTMANQLSASMAQVPPPPGGQYDGTDVPEKKKAPWITDKEQRSRSRSPRRYRDRTRSPSRDHSRREHRDRSPANGHYESRRYGSSYDNRAPPPPRTFEERAQNKEAMMQNVRDSSQQDRRVYVGNLSYDVKWHHLKDFMRKGTASPTSNMNDKGTDFTHSGRRPLR